MKMKAAQKVHYEAGPNMTPLVDVVMVILIFLMLTGSFAVGQRFLQSNLPLTSTGAGAVKLDNVPKDEPMEIRVRSQGETAWIADVGGVPIRGDQDALERRLRGQFEAFVRSLGRPAEHDGLPAPSGPPTPEQADALARTCLRFGIELVGPPLG